MLLPVSFIPFSRFFLRIPSAILFRDLTQSLINIYLILPRAKRENSPILISISSVIDSNRDQESSISKRKFKHYDELQKFTEVTEIKKLIIAIALSICAISASIHA